MNNILVGKARPYIPFTNNTISQSFYDTCNVTPVWPFRPSLGATIQSNIDGPKHISSVGVCDPTTATVTIFENWSQYANMSAMSLDGLLSPISLYPTPYATTFNVAQHRRSLCPYCSGLGIYNYKDIVNAPIPVQQASLTDVIQIPDLPTVQKTIPCTFCLPDEEIKKFTQRGAQPSEVTPPYLIGSGTDRTIISDRATALQYRSSIINNYTLNPIVLTTGEFSCSMHKQSKDTCAHSIEVVAFGNIKPPDGNNLRASASYNPNKNYDAFETSNPNPNFQQNQRFFGLRGPLMLHSWGYDLEGYPVPNSSGEYKLLSNGQRVTDINGNYVGKNQVLQSDGTYSPPYKESTFYKSWAQQPATWPVGPIDLRWDELGRVWTIGANYKPVWVVIEHDLLNDDPVRGIVVESSYSNSPLPTGLRKLVFVKDTMGMFSAPRGAALYCKYDSVNGFYEPIYNRPLVTSGTIEGANTAKIYTAYTPSTVSEDIVSNYTTVFDNPLNLTVNYNTIGLFTFLNGKWILQASS
jgi:hypothetical protein